MKRILRWLCFRQIHIRQEEGTLRDVSGFVHRVMCCKDCGCIL